MASTGRPVRWEELPDEISLHILSYLEPADIAGLQLVSCKLRKLCLDNELWKRLCFESSQWYRDLKFRRAPVSFSPSPLASAGNPSPESIAAAAPSSQNGEGKDMAQNTLEPEPVMHSRWRGLQDMANWDPSFPEEKVSWYDEYIQRQGPASVNWLQTPRIRDRGCEAIIEARGVDLYHPYSGNDGIGTMLAVSPLDDGSVCLWDVNGTRTRAGAVLGRSKKDVLFIDGPGSQNLRRSKRVDTGVTECVRVDNHTHRAYFAVQSHLIEIDLERLDVVSRESFEWSITTLSPINPGVPLTVGTSLGIHLHDFRGRARPRTYDAVERVDGPDSEGMNVFRSIFDPRPLPPYAPLSQPTPLSIVHLPEPGGQGLVSNDVYVSGRFTSILHYDRRKFPNIAGSIHSGATINSMVALPFPFPMLDNAFRRNGELTAEQVSRAKAASHGRTLIAGGIYRSKGSLEIYGLQPGRESPHGEVMQQYAASQNRRAAASSSILSVANHGTKIVFSDGSGYLHWFERNGETLCRKLKIGHCRREEGWSFFPLRNPGGEMARKIVSTQGAQNQNQEQERANNDNVLFWTGERLGMVTFTPSPRFMEKDFEGPKDAETLAEEQDGRRYAEQMRDALHRQADEVKFMANFGGGSRAGR